MIFIGLVELYQVFSFFADIWARLSLTKTTHKITENIIVVETNTKPMKIWWLSRLNEGQSSLLIWSKVSITKEQSTNPAKSGPFRCRESLKLVATITFEYKEGLNLPIIMHKPVGDVLHTKLWYAYSLHKNHDIVNIPYFRKHGYWHKHNKIRAISKI